MGSEMCIRDRIKTTLLGQWLAAGYADMVRAMRLNRFQDGIEVHPVTAEERVFAVAIHAAQRAPGQANKDGGYPGVTGLALEREKDFGDLQMIGAGLRNASALTGLGHWHRLNATTDGTRATDHESGVTTAGHGGTSEMPFQPHAAQTALGQPRQGGVRIKFLHLGQRRPGLVPLLQLVVRVANFQQAVRQLGAVGILVL